jgi:hypothetical protein
MNTRIIYTNAEGGVSIIVPAGSIEACMKDIPEGTEYEIISAEDIPTDRTFRDAWEKSGKAIQHNLSKCKNIAHEKRRAKRSDEFAPLDIEATIPAKAVQAESKRQAVRDKYTTMQTAIDLATTIDEIKAAMP